MKSILSFQFCRTVFISLDAEPGGEQNNFLNKKVQKHLFFQFVLLFLNRFIINLTQKSLLYHEQIIWMVPGITDMNLYSGIESFKYMYIITKVMNTGTYTYMYMQIIS